MMNQLDIGMEHNHEMVHDVSAAWHSFQSAYDIAPPSSVSSFVDHYDVYKWKPNNVSITISCGERGAIFQLIVLSVSCTIYHNIKY